MDTRLEQNELPGRDGNISELTPDLAATIRDFARERYAEPSDDDIEIDDDAPVHHNGDEGYWVQAWVYVREDDLTPRYHVNVGNLGTVYDGLVETEARAAFDEYVAQSKANYGRVAAESVTLLRDGDIVSEHHGAQEAQS